MEPRAAFFVGYLTSMVGVPLRSVALMNTIGQHATGALAEAIDAHVKNLQDSSGETVDHVLRVEAILAQHALAVPTRPQAFDSWVTWSGAVSRAIGGAVASSSPTAAGLVAGGFFGDLVATIQVGQLVTALQGVASDEAELGTHAAAHAKLAARAVERIEIAMRHPALPASARVQLGAAVAAYRRAPAIDASLPAAQRHAALLQLRTDLNLRGKDLLAAFSG